MWVEAALHTAARKLVVGLCSCLPTALTHSLCVARRLPCPKRFRSCLTALWHLMLGPTHASHLFQRLESTHSQPAS